jgi:hypothetical protein
VAVKPTLEQALRRLRLDENLTEDVTDAIEQAHAQAEAFLDGTLYETVVAATAAAKGIFATADIIAAQLLLVDVLVAANDADAKKLKTEAAYNILRRHRNMGC